MLEIRRGDVVFVDLRGAVGNEKQGTRPCVVVQNDGGNRGSPLTIVAPLTDAEHQGKRYAQQVFIRAADLGYEGKDSLVECGHLREIDREARIDERRGIWCHLSDELMADVDKALRASLGLPAQA
ncbi:MAG: type II toxin-antitoxin system PemK/MazF family toxin [Gaiellaceae bacterium]